MITLDMQTVMFANVIINAVCLIVLLMLWYQNRQRYSGLSFWVLDWVLLTGGTLLITLQGSIPSWASMLLSSSMLIGGTFILSFGLSRFAGKKHNPIIISSVFVVLAIFIGIQGYFIYVQNDLIVRNYNVAIGLLLAFALGMWLMFKGVSPEIRRISKGAGIAFAVLAFISFIRIMGFTLTPQTSNQFLQSGKFDTMAVALLVGAMAYLVFNLVLMVNKRLYIETKEMQDEVNRRKMEFQTTFQTTSVAFGILVNRVVKEANDAYCQMLGYSWEDILGKETRMFFPTDEEYRAVGQIYQKVMESGSATAEIRLLCKNGNILNAIVTISAFDKNDLSKGVVFSALDITERKKLEEKNVYLASFPETNTSPVVEVDMEGKIRYQNPACKRIFPDLATLGLNHPFFAPWTQAVKALQKTDVMQPVIHEVTVNDLVYEQTYFAIGKNQIRIYTGDITKRKKAEERLVDSEVRYRRLFETAQDAILILNGDTGQIIDANPFIKDLLGYSLEELVGKNLWEIGSMKDTLASKISYRQLYESGYVRYHNLPLITKDGRQVDVEVVANAYPVDHQRVIQCNIRDMTESKRAEEALKNREEFLNNIIEKPPSALWISDEKGTIIRMNNALRDLLKIKDEEIIGKYNVLEDAQIIEQGYLPLVKSVFEEGKTINFILDYDTSKEKQITPMATTHRELEIVITAIRDKEGQIIHAIAQEKDITEQKQAQLALRESEEKYRLIVEKTGDIIFTFNDKGEFLYVSPSVKSVLGYNPAELIGQTFMSLVHPDDVDSLQQVIRKNVKGGYRTPGGNRYRIRNISSEWRWHNASGNAVFDENGKFLYFIAISKDITEHKRAEESLQESEEKYRLIVENSKDIIFTLNEGVFIYVSPSIKKMLGYNPADLIGLSFISLVHPDDRHIIDDAIRNGDEDAGQTAGGHQYRLRHSSGEWRWYVSRGTKMVVTRGKSINFIGIASDINERKQAEQVIYASEENFRSSIDNSPLGIRISDIENKTLYVNQALLDIFGYKSVDEVRNKSPQEHYSPESYSDYLKMREKYGLGEVIPDQVDIDIVCKDGTIRHLQSLFKEVLWNGKKQYQTLYNDITDRKQVEGMTRQLEVMKQVDRLRTDLLANVSHELRTPLASIKGYATTLLRKDVKWSAKQQQDFLKIIDNETDRLIRLINDILDVSRIDGGALKIRQQQCQVVNIAESIKSRLKVMTKKHKLVIDIPKTLPAVFADDMRIGQVISNLVDNAVKFSPAGSEISITASQSEDKVIINVTDHGEGMTEEVMSKLFNRFYQAENIVSGRQKGTGLGLVICRGIIESHGGDIWVESKLGTGSKFSFSLPAWKEESSG